MAKGSVRKKGKKWYYRFYIEDESGNLVQREFVGTESKSETEALLRKAMEDYEGKEIRCKVRKRHGGYAAGYVGGGRTETRQFKQRHRDGVSGNGQSYQTAPYRQPKAENRHRRPFTGVYRLSQLWRHKS